MHKHHCKIALSVFYPCTIPEYHKKAEAGTDLPYCMEYLFYFLCPFSLAQFLPKCQLYDSHFVLKETTPKLKRVFNAPVQSLRDNFKK